MAIQSEFRICKSSKIFASNFELTIAFISTLNTFRIVVSLQKHIQDLCKSLKLWKSLHQQKAAIMIWNGVISEIHDVGHLILRVSVWNFAGDWLRHQSHFPWKEGDYECSSDTTAKWTEFMYLCNVIALCYQNTKPAKILVSSVPKEKQRGQTRKTKKGNQN